MRAEKLETQNGIRNNRNVCQRCDALGASLRTLNSKATPTTAPIPIEVSQIPGEESKCAMKSGALGNADISDPVPLSARETRLSFLFVELSALPVSPYLCHPELKDSPAHKDCTKSRKD